MEGAVALAVPSGYGVQTINLWDPQLDHALQIIILRVFEDSRS
jgi:hypothetical protein